MVLIMAKMWSNRANDHISSMINAIEGALEEECPVRPEGWWR